MNVKKLRESLGMTQTDFWKRVKITQSGGSRYERQRRGLPETVDLLLVIAYGTPLQSAEQVRKLRWK
jgi:transcriptional regulator with XRE-family HTH domain